MSRHGQCYLALSGANIVLSPKNGNDLAINGLIYTIPSAGISLAPAGLTATTLYYIYAYMNAGEMTLEASTTVHSTDATTGVKIKTGDPTRTLVGMARPIAGPAWVNSGTQRFVVSWFNRAAKSSINTISAVSTSSTSNVELGGAASRAEFLSWPNEAVTLSLSGASGATVWASGGCSITVDLDGSSTGPIVSVATNAASNSMPLSSTVVINVSEGYHYMNAFGLVTAGNTVSYTVTNFAVIGG